MEILYKSLSKYFVILAGIILQFSLSMHSFVNLVYLLPQSLHRKALRTQMNHRLLVAAKFTVLIKYTFLRLFMANQPS